MVGAVVNSETGGRVVGVDRAGTDDAQEVGRVLGGPEAGSGRSEEEVSKDLELPGADNGSLAERGRQIWVCCFTQPLWRNLLQNMHGLGLALAVKTL